MQNLSNEADPMFDMCDEQTVEEERGLGVKIRQTNLLGLGRQLGFRASAAKLLEVVDSSSSGMHERFYVYVAAADFHG